VRILVVSDLHYRLAHYDWLVRAADGVHVVALVGDLADVVSPVPLELQVVVVEKCLGLPSDRAVVLVASGNHDLDGPGATESRLPAGCNGPGPVRSTSTGPASRSAGSGSPSAPGGTVPSRVSRWSGSWSRRRTTDRTGQTAASTSIRPASCVAEVTGRCLPERPSAVRGRLHPMTRRRGALRCVMRPMGRRGCCQAPG